MIKKYRKKSKNLTLMKLIDIKWRKTFHSLRNSYFTDGQETWEVDRAWQVTRRPTPVDTCFLFDDWLSLDTSSFLAPILRPDGQCPDVTWFNMTRVRDSEIIYRHGHEMWDAEMLIAALIETSPTYNHLNIILRSVLHPCHMSASLFKLLLNSGMCF